MTSYPNGKPSAYEFFLPPGWIRLDLRGEVSDEAKRYASHLMAVVDAPKDRKARMRTKLTGQMVQQLSKAKEQGVLDMAVPVANEYAPYAHTSFAFRPLPLPKDEKPINFISYIASRDNSAQFIEMNELIALRTEKRVCHEDLDVQAELNQEMSTLEVDPQQVVQIEPGQKLFSSQVQYYIGDPHKSDNWMMVVFSAADDGTEMMVEFSKHLTVLFDEIMKTVRFHD
ncbi:MAG: hypothetical protein LBR20_07475 [Propionibacteriaceae bacterium]|jgi:hypothetical protein|nr:hypothetical protein [Propionibacteriaceae bacterium]